MGTHTCAMIGNALIIMSAASFKSQLSHMHFPTAYSPPGVPGIISHGIFVAPSVWPLATDIYGSLLCQYYQSYQLTEFIISTSNSLVHTEILIYLICIKIKHYLIC
jgi:hypothetical protein